MSPPPPPPPLPLTPMLLLINSHFKNCPPHTAHSHSQRTTLVFPQKRLSCHLYICDTYQRTRVLVFSYCTGIYLFIYLFVYKSSAHLQHLYSLSLTWVFPPALACTSDLERLMDELKELKKEPTRLHKPYATSS